MRKSPTWANMREHEYAHLYMGGIHVKESYMGQHAQAWACAPLYGGHANKSSTLIIMF